MKKSLTLNLRVDHLQDIGIPEKFWNLDISTCAASEGSMKRVLNYVNKIRNARNAAMGILLVGPPKSFKTFFLCHVLKVAAASVPYTAQYCTMQRLTNIYFGRDRDWGDFETFATSADFFGLDGLDYAQNEHQVKAFSTLLSLRIDANRPTLVTTELEATALQGSYKSKVCEMLNDCTFTLNCSVDEFKRRAALAKKKESFEI